LGEVMTPMIRANKPIGGAGVDAGSVIAGSSHWRAGEGQTRQL
jgi:hypothetical protein